jgi:hypothetical protein
VTGVEVTPVIFGKFVSYRKVIVEEAVLPLRAGSKAELAGI